MDFVGEVVKNSPLENPDLSSLETCLVAYHKFSRVWGVHPRYLVQIILSFLIILLNAHVP